MKLSGWALPIWGQKSNQVSSLITSRSSSPLLLTANTDTVYCFAVLDLPADGPTVVEVPPGSGPGTVDDAFFRFVIDMGAAGTGPRPGGKYLILPPDYKGEVPKDKKDGGEIVRRTLLRLCGSCRAPGLPQGRQAGHVFKAVPGRRENLFAQQSRRSAAEDGVVNASKVPFNTVHANDFSSITNWIISKKSRSMSRDRAAWHRRLDRYP